MSFPYSFHDINFQKIPNAFKLFVKEFKLVVKENYSFTLAVTLASSLKKKKSVFFTHILQEICAAPLLDRILR